LGHGKSKRKINNQSILVYKRFESISLAFVIIIRNNNSILGSGTSIKHGHQIWEQFYRCNFTKARKSTEYKEICAVLVLLDVVSSLTDLDTSVSTSVSSAGVSSIALSVVAGTSTMQSLVSGNFLASRTLNIVWIWKFWVTTMSRRTA
jgi:hypothetical protein